MRSGRIVRARWRAEAASRAWIDGAIFANELTSTPRLADQTVIVMSRMNRLGRGDESRSPQR